MKQLLTTLLLLFSLTLSAQVHVVEGPKKKPQSNTVFKSNHQQNSTKTKSENGNRGGKSTYQSKKSNASSSPKYKISTDQYVDIGLSVKWAGYDAGASSPEQIGIFCSWPLKNPLPSYITNEWNGGRLPTETEIRELCTKCKFSKINYKGTKGTMVTGPNGNSIFCPLSGAMYEGTPMKQGIGVSVNYWASSYGQSVNGAIDKNSVGFLDVWDSAARYYTINLYSNRLIEDSKKCVRFVKY